MFEDGSVSSQDTGGAPTPPSDAERAIDEILTDATWRRAVALRDLGQSPEYEEEVRKLKADAKRRLLALQREARADELRNLESACNLTIRDSMYVHNRIASLTQEGEQ